MPEKNVHGYMWYPDMQEPLSVAELIEALEAEVECAYGLFLKHAKSPDDVFVFVAPDMYFSNRLSARRSLTPEHGNYIIHRLSEISQRFPNMVLFAGTLEWRKPINSPGL